MRVRLSRARDAAGCWGRPQPSRQTTFPITRRISNLGKIVDGPSGTRTVLESRPEDGTTGAHDRRGSPTLLPPPMSFLELPRTALDEPLGALVAREAARMPDRLAAKGRA